MRFLPVILYTMNSKWNVDTTQNEHSVLLMAKMEKSESEDAAKEALHSLRQKELYKERYGKEISASSGRLSYFSEVMANTLLLIPTIRNLCSGYNFDRYFPQIGHLRF